MATEVAICNLALTAVGSNTITALNDNTTEAQMCNIYYSLYRDYLLRIHPWNFTQTRASLAQLATAPAFGFDYAFQLPTDCLRVCETSLGQYDEWRIEGRSLVCNQSEVSIVYNKYVTDPGLFDPAFSITLGYLLAWKLSKVLTGKTGFTDKLRDEYHEHLAIARTVDGMEGTPVIIKDTSMIDVRQANLVQDRNQNSL